MAYTDYLVTLRPLDFFMLGGENNFDFGSQKRQTEQRYYILSEPKPAQTTLLGALRYALLAANGALISDFSDESQRRRAAELVGAQSFSMEQERHFGRIGSISPLFLTHWEGDQRQWLIPTPKNHKASQADKVPYAPFRVEPYPQGLLGSREETYAVDYAAKNGTGGGWLNLATGMVHSDSSLFISTVQVGINAHRTDGVRDREESFFKKQRLTFRNRQDAFAFFARLEPEAAKALEAGVSVGVGQNKTPFLLTATPTPDTLEDAIRACLSRHYTGPAFYYAAGDCYLETTPQCFYCGKAKLFRHLTTDTGKTSYYGRLTRTHTLYRTLAAGAVFYCEQMPESQLPCVKIGMNSFIKIGGTRQ